MKEAQEQDEVLNIVKKWIKIDPPKSMAEIKSLPQDVHVYHQHLSVLNVDEGNLVVMSKSPGSFTKEVQRILVPNQANSFNFLHMHLLARHFGTQATCGRAALKFFWPGMTSDIKSKSRSATPVWPKSGRST